MMSKILACITAALFILFMGLIPIHTWAIPMAIGSLIVTVILGFNAYADDKDDE